MTHIKKSGILSIYIIICCCSTLKAQSVFPDLMINNTTISSGTQIYTNSTGIMAPGDASSVHVNQNAQVDFKAGKQIHLHPGFEATNFTSSGNFHAYIQANDFDVIPITSSTVGKLEKFEMGIKLSSTITSQIDAYLSGGTGINPYDPDRISVEATFTSPTGVNKLIYGFYFKDYTVSANNWVAVTNDYPWRVRFAPTEIGVWTCSIKVTSPSFSLQQAYNIHFTCVSSNNPGYLQMGAHYRQLRFSETHQSFFAIGQNVAWAESALPSGYNAQRSNIQDIAAKGGNYTRLVLAPWASAVEWEKLGDYDQRQPHLWELDEIFNQAHANNIYIHLCLEMHTQYNINPPWPSTPGWNNNPYKSGNQNIIPGINQPIDFFTNTTAEHFFQKRLRYIVARWGYSTNLSAYELFSEVDAVDGYRVNGVDNPPFINAVYWWHYWMVDYIKNTLGETKHLVTTSYSGAPDPNIYHLNSIDITSMHAYINGLNQNYNTRWDYCNNGPAALVNYPKPYILGEMGEQTMSTALDDCSDWGFHNALWSTAFMGGFGAGLYWWEWNNTYFNYRANFTTLKSFMNGINFESSLFTSQKSLGNAKTIESFSLVNNDESRVYGWMHNRTFYSGTMYSCGGGGPFPGVHSKEELQIKGLKMLKKYDLEWYRVPHGGNVSLYSTGTKQTTISGTLKQNVYDMFLYAPEYAYKMYRQGTRSEVDNVADTVNCSSDTLRFDGVYEDDTLGTLYTYQWNFGNGVTSTLVHPKICYQQAGAYPLTVIITKISSGVSVTLTEIVIVQNNCPMSAPKANGMEINAQQVGQSTEKITAVEDPKHTINGIELYPNPNNGSFIIETSFSGQKINNSIVVYDIIGNIIKEMVMSTDKIIIDISSFPKGMYIVKISNENGIKMEKIVYQ